jgi:hypothetical protein
MTETQAIIESYLDIGAETPSEIAFSIIAEVKAILTGREGGLLRNRKGSIHGEVSEPGMISKQPISDEFLIATSLQKTYYRTSEQSLST